MLAINYSCVLVTRNLLVPSLRICMLWDVACMLMGWNSSDTCCTLPWSAFLFHLMDNYNVILPRVSNYHSTFFATQFHSLVDTILLLKIVSYRIRIILQLFIESNSILCRRKLIFYTSNNWQYARLVKMTLFNLEAVQRNINCWCIRILYDSW